MKNVMKILVLICLERGREREWGRGGEGEGEEGGRGREGKGRKEEGEVRLENRKMIYTENIFNIYTGSRA